MRGLPVCPSEFISRRGIKTKALEIISQAIRDPKTQCWNCACCVNTSGYGFVMLENRQVLVHRLVWVALKGKLTKGKLVLHRCDNTKCVNPSHLYKGTQFESVQDSFLRNRSKAWGSKAKSTPQIVLEIRALSASGWWTQGLLSEAFGVSQALVSTIVTGKRWGWI